MARRRFAGRTRRARAARRRRLFYAFGTAAVLLALVWRTWFAHPPAPSPDLPPDRFLPVYLRAAQANDVPWQLLAAINAVETNYNRVRPMVSPAGALGPMQFMPATWREYGVDVLHPRKRGNPMNFLDAVFASARLLHRWGMTDSPARTRARWIAHIAGAYNAGPGAWNNSSAETVHYRAAVVRLFFLIRRDVRIPAADVRYWRRLPLARIAAAAAGALPLYPPGYPPVRHAGR